MPRWLRRTAVVLLGCAVLAALPRLSDGLLRRALIAWTRRAAGAALTVRFLHANPFSGRVEIRDIAVADPRRPGRDFFRCAQAVFQFSPRAFFKGPVLARQAEIAGIELDAPRLSRPQDGAEGLFDSPGDEPGRAERLLAAARLLPQAERRLASLKARIAALSAQTRGLSGAPLSYPRQRSRRAALERTAQELRQELEKSREEGADALRGVADALAAAESGQERRVERALAAQGLPADDEAGASRRLLAPLAAGKIAAALAWARWFDRPPAAAPAIPWRPTLFIETTQLSGRLPRAFRDQDMELEGMILGLAFGARVPGKPTRLFVKGEVPDGSSVLGLQGSFGPSAGAGFSAVAFHYSGVDLAGLSLGDRILGARIERGLGRVNGTLRIVGGQVDGRVSLVAEGLRLSPRLNLPASAAGPCADQIEKRRNLKADFLIQGDEDAPLVSVDSDLGSDLARTLLRTAPGPWLARLRAVRRAAQAADAPRLAAFRAAAARRRERLLAPLREEGAALDRALGPLSGESIEASLPAQ